MSSTKPWPTSRKPRLSPEVNRLPSTEVRHRRSWGAIARLLIPVFGVAIALSAPTTIGAAGPETARDTGGHLLFPDIRYAHAAADPAQNRLDIYRPRHIDGPMPVVVWVHGGGWYQGGKAASIAKKAEMFTADGNLFVSVNYRLSPFPQSPGWLRPGRVMFPDHPRDVAAAIAWVGRNAHRFGGDPRRIVLIGHSAGAQIVSLIGTNPAFLRARSVNPSVVRGVISLDAYGLSVPDLANPGSRWPFTREMLWNAFGAPREPGSTRRWRRASPVRHADPGDPPFLLVVSSFSGRRVVESRVMSRKLGQAPRRGSLSVALDHRNINTLLGEVGPGAEETRRVRAFTRAVTGPAVQARIRVRVIRGRYAIRPGAVRARVTAITRVRATGKGTSLRCRLDGQPYRPCPGRRTFRLGPGRHALTAVASDITGRTTARTVRRFKVIPPR